MRRFRFLVILLASSCLLGVGVSLPARAALIGTQQVLHANHPARGQVRDFLAREDVRRVLAGQGVDPAQVQARVDAMSDEEVAEVAQRIETLPAGGDFAGAFLGIAFVIFLILLITDILGLTKVFPFTRPVR